MKRFFRRLFLKRRLASLNAHLDLIDRERQMLDVSERHCVRAVNATRLALLNLDVRARHHA